MTGQCLCVGCQGGTPPRCPYPLTTHGRCSHHLDNVCQAVVVRSPRRIQRKRTKGWRMPEGAIYVGRGTEWGNPWRVGDPLMTETPTRDGDGSWRVQEFVLTADLAVALYRAAFAPDAPTARADLAGRDLACWCPLDQPCHADVLLEIANHLEETR